MIMKPEAGVSRIRQLVSAGAKQRNKSHLNPRQKLRLKLRLKLGQKP
jgi:hypothetical protein